MSNSLTEHQMSAIYTQLWYLAQKDASGRWVYYTGLADKERQSLTDTFTDVLDIERRFLIGSDFPVVKDETENADPGHTTVPEVAEPPQLGIHDPKHYLFGEKKLWIPWALDAQSGAKRGSYPKGYPVGAVVHWTAGHRNGLTNGNSVMRSSGMLYLLLDHLGNLAQSDNLGQHGYHAGVSSYPGLSGYVSDDLVGVEVMAAGNLTLKDGHYYPWWDRANGGSGAHQYLPSNRIPSNEVVHVKTKTGNIAAGYYHAYTDAQQLVLRKTLCWLHLNNPDVFKLDFVVGHDEVSPTRKTDPGGAIVIGGKVHTMPEFRNVLKADVEQILKNRKAA